MKQCKIKTEDGGDGKTRMQARRRKGCGSLFLRNGIWYAKWRKNGISKTQSTGIRDDSGTIDGMTPRQRADEKLMDLTEPLRMRHREDALATIVRQMQTPEERRIGNIKAAMRQVRIGRLAEIFRESVRRPDCSRDMLEFYCRAVDRLADWIGRDATVRSIDGQIAEKYAAELRKGRASGTYNKQLNALALVWRACEGQAGIECGENPWTGIARRKSDSHDRRAFTAAETETMMATAKGDMRKLVAVLLYTGLRLGDACMLSWRDIRGDVVYVTTAKRGRKVAIPLHPTLAEAIGSRKNDGFVMPEMARRYSETRQGKSNVSRSVKRLIERCGIQTSVRSETGRLRPDATAHSLRHTFVTRAIEAGVPEYAVQAIVGHATRAMTDHYTHISDAAVAKAFAGVR